MIRNPLPETVTATHKIVALVAGQLFAYKAKLGEVWLPVTMLRALAYRKITEDVVGVNWYHRSSSGLATQLVPGVDDVAFNVLANTEVEQAVPNGVVLMTMAPLQSSLAGACAFVFDKAILVRKSMSKNFAFMVPGFRKSYFLSDIFCSS
jgi:hypothetical protein